MKFIAPAIAACAIAAPTLAVAETPSILLEACNAMEPAAKRLECLRAANQVPRQDAAKPAAAPRSTLSQPLPAYSAPRTTSSGQTCFVGPRGGTYTITKSGKKNYGGC